MKRSLIIEAATLLLIASSAIGAEIQADFLMDRDPVIRLPDPIRVFTPASVDIWNQALQRPDTDLQRMAAETIAQAHERGVPNLAKTIPALEAILTGESSHPVARFAAARALISLESESSSDKLLQASQKYGADLRQIVEPALARWNDGNIKEIWIKRLKAPQQRPRDLILAIHSLGRTGELSALPMIKSIALDRLHGNDLRLEAAWAAGQLADVGLEQDASFLGQSKQRSPVVDRLCAIRLLARHTNDASRQLLTELATDPEPTVAAAALRRLNEIDPSLVVPLAETAMTNADPHVRQEGAHAYLSQATPDRIGPVSLLLDDNHPGIRKQVREELYRLAQNPELSNPIRAATMKVLSGSRWQGQEQASLLLGALEHKPASMRLVQLLESPRDEVMVASAWALRNVADPRTIMSILDKARRQTIERKAKVSLSIDLQVAHLFEAFGRMRAKEAIPLLTEYIPKTPMMGERSRAGAIWALGWIHEGTPDKPLCQAFLDRIMDMSIFPPELNIVKVQSSVALARMRDVDHGPALRPLLDQPLTNSDVGMALRWSIKELTGEVVPPPEPGQIQQGVSFLDPLVPSEPNNQ